MKLKYYLRGLGIGIICTAIIMGIALSGNKKETLTDAEIIERARLLGMVMEDEAGESDGAQSSEVRNPINNTKEDKEKESENSKLNDSTKDDKAEDQKNNQGDKPDEKENSSSEEDPSEDEKSESENGVQSQESTQTKAEGTQEVVKIEIKTGEYSDVISRKLFEAGLIEDAEAFNSYLTKKGADDSLRVGVFEIPKGATEDEIIQILQK